MWTVSADVIVYKSNIIEYFHVYRSTDLLIAEISSKGRQRQDYLDIIVTLRVYSSLSVRLDLSL